MPTTSSIQFSNVVRACRLCMFSFSVEIFFLFSCFSHYTIFYATIIPVSKEVFLIVWCILRSPSSLLFPYLYLDCFIFLALLPLSCSLNSTPNSFSSVQGLVLEDIFVLIILRAYRPKCNIIHCTLL